MYLTKDELERSLSIIDLSDPDNGLHAVNIMVDNIKNALAKYQTNIEIIRNHPIVDVEDNYKK